MTVAEFMRTALTHPTLGYYTRSAEQFGERGDFVTSVTMTPVYGELVGLWIVSMWQAAGSPAAWKLVEVGPGTGRLMSDVLRVVRKFAPAAQGVQVHLVDVSPALRREQAKSLQVELPSGHRVEAVSGATASGIPVHWHARLASVPCDAQVPELIVGHEILDALPAHQFIKTAAGWRERLVDVANPGDAEHGDGTTRRFQFITSQEETPALRACFAPAGSSEHQANAVAALQAAAELERRGAAGAPGREPQRARILQHPRANRVLSEAEVHHVHGDAGSGRQAAPSMLLDSAAAAAGKAGDAALMQSDDLLASIKAVGALTEPGAVGSASSAPLSAADSPADHFAYSQLRTAPHELQAAADSAAIGTVVEFSPAAAGFAYEVSARVGTTGGAALLVDYGSDGVPESSSGTLRGIRHHKFVHALETPGEIDLTVDADFSVVRHAAAASGVARATGPVPQGAWLLAMGIAQRWEQLTAQSVDEEFLRNTGLAMERLISPKQMGEMYKFIAITPEHGDMVATGFTEAAAIAEQGFDVQLSTEEPREEP